jgi:hypothetical protein
MADSIRGDDLWHTVLDGYGCDRSLVCRVSHTVLSQQAAAPWNVGNESPEVMGDCRSYASYDVAIATRK